MKKSILALAFVAGLSGLQAGTVSVPVDKNPAPSTEPAAPYSGSIWERSTLTGDWGGLRNDLAAHGFTVDLNGVYTFQGVTSGGTQHGDSTGNLFSGDLTLNFDTGKMGLWPGGFLKVRFEGRGGDSVQNRVGGISPVNGDSVAPNVSGKIGETAWALTELSYTQFLSEKFGVVLGLLNATSADSNPIAGSMISNDHFMNTGFLYSPVEGATAPTVTLGGGLVFLPTKNIQGSVLVIGSTETAGNNPFDLYQGTTFATEWTFKYELGQHPGGMTVGGLYSINRDRANLGADGRLFFGTLLTTGQVLTNQNDAWAIYWNGYQYIQGDEKKGWGLFGRVGFGDNDTNPIRFNFAAGLGGTSPIPGRETDRWGLGLYYIDIAHLDVLQTLNLNHETGAEFFYNIALTPWAHLSLDAQVVDPVVQRADTAWVLGTRLVITF